MTDGGRSTGPSGAPGTAGYGIGVAVFGAVLHIALVTAAFGLITLATDVPPVSEIEAGPLLGPAVVGASALVLLVGGVGRAVRPVRRAVLIPAVAVGVVSALLALLVGGALFAVQVDEPVRALVFLGAHLATPFSLALAASAAAVHACVAVLISRRASGAGPARWPWERDEDEE